jgi:lysophospholipase L1-like esterase
LIPNQTLSPLGCLRSDHNYPHLTAASLGLALTDLSCSGATTADMTAPQQTSAGTNPPQLEAITPADKVVTLQIGGNDINFGGILENCAAATPYGPTKVGWTCKSYYTAGGTDHISAAVQALRPRVTAVLGQIRTSAPNAEILLVGYPAILPATGNGCWPQMPFTYTDAPYLRAKEVELNSALADVAAATGAHYVDTYTPSTSHNACTTESTRWIEPFVPASPAAPVHPNAAGEAAMASLVTAALPRAGD